MIECIFTVDYEIYGNGEGSLRELAYEPAERLRAIFLKHGARFVVFPDVAELEMIETHGSDPFIGSIKEQLEDFHKKGFELGLHIHPWWYKARREKGAWILDQSEYNLCTQPADRINEVIDRAISYLRRLVGLPGFTPLSFRAGHLLFQPTQPLADILAARGVRLDSSVYKGGLWRQYKLDYRRAPKRAHHWRFRGDVTTPDTRGVLLEVPIYTQLEPVWRLFTSKRVGLQRGGATAAQTGRKAISRIADIARFRYPLKFDLGQMTKDEIVRMTNTILKDDRRDPMALRPVVVIMHTKDPLDYEVINALPVWLRQNGVTVSIFRDIEDKIRALNSQEGER